MPKSKHRHKGSGKALRHPGKGRSLPGNPMMLDDGYGRSKQIFQDEFYELFRSSMPVDTDLLIDILFENVFDWRTRTPSTASRDETFAEFTNDEYRDEGEDLRTIEMAEIALGFIVEHEMVCVDGDEITLHPRFIPLLTEHGEPQV
jgi:hypothetical protein